ncbi:hypothetical protein D3C78_1358830 [compost metagenome]
MTAILLLHGGANSLFRSKCVPGAGLRPEWRYWSLRQAGAYFGVGRGRIEESVALLVPTQGAGQRSRQISFRKCAGRRKVRVFAANRLEGSARAHRGGLPTAREEVGVARRVCPSSHGVGRCRLVSLLTGEEWRRAKGVGLARRRAKRRSEKGNQKGGNPPLAGPSSRFNYPG